MEYCLHNICILESLKSMPSIYNLPLRNLGLLPFLYAFCITVLSSFFLFLSLGVTSSAIYIRFLNSFFLQRISLLSGRYKNLVIIGRGEPSVLSGPTRWAFSMAGFSLKSFEIIFYKASMQSSSDRSGIF